MFTPQEIAVNSAIADMKKRRVHSDSDGGITRRTSAFVATQLSTMRLGTGRGSGLLLGRRGRQGSEGILGRIRAMFRPAPVKRSRVAATATLATFMEEEEEDGGEVGSSTRMAAVNTSAPLDEGAEGDSGSKGLV